MKPFKVKFILGDNIDRQIYVESNEKPLKGEVYTLKDATGKLEDIKITEVSKYIIKAVDNVANIEYWCKTEKYEASASVIGFSKS